MLCWLTACYNTSILTEDSLRVKSFCLDPLQFSLDVDNRYDMYHISSWYGCIMQGMQTPSTTKKSHLKYWGHTTTNKGWSLIHMNFDMFHKTFLICVNLAALVAL